MKLKSKSKSDSNTASPVTDALNVLLSDYQVYYQNLRGFHWNVKGSHFFVLHEKFESWYGDASEAIDEIAERILALKATPLHAFSDYLKFATIQEAKELSEQKDIIKRLIKDTELLVAAQKKALEVAKAADDDATADMVTQYVHDTEKLLWMLNAWAD